MSLSRLIRKPPLHESTAPSLQMTFQTVQERRGRPRHRDDRLCCEMLGVESVGVGSPSPIVENHTLSGEAGYLLAEVRSAID